MSKSLDIKILGIKSLVSGNAISAHPHGLSHDGAIEIQGQGWMSQRDVEKIGQMQRK
jgi:hypothetical protein